MMEGWNFVLIAPIFPNILLSLKKKKLNWKVVHSLFSIEYKVTDFMKVYFKNNCLSSSLNEIKRMENHSSFY